MITINTVPEIMYALSALTRFMTRATSQHYGYAKQVLRHLKGVKHLKLTWCAQTVKAPFQRGQLFGFADAFSTSEAELISVASCAQEVNFCRKLATELGFIQPGPIPIAEDNNGAIALLEHEHFKGHGTPSICTFAGASCATTSTLAFYASIVASPRASSSRRLSLLRAKWLLARQTRLAPSTLPVSSALYSCILELRGGI